MTIRRVLAALAISFSLVVLAVPLLSRMIKRENVPTTEADIANLIAQLDTPDPLSAEALLSKAINDKTLPLFHEALALHPKIGALIYLSRLVAFHANPSSEPVLA